MPRFATHHYKVLAAAMLASKPTRWHDSAKQIQWSACIMAIAAQLEADNPDFDQAKWYKACDGEQDFA